MPDRAQVFQSIVKSRASTLSLQELEREHIERVLANSDPLERAATRLGINPTTLWRKRKRYRLAAGLIGGPSSRS